MRIENPGLFFPLVMAILFVGMAVCLYIIIRFFRRSSQPPKPTPKSSAGGGAKRIGDWLSEPVSSSPSPKSPDLSRSLVPTAPDRPVDLPGKEVVAVIPETERVVEIMRVLRVGALGELVLEANGKRYKRLVEIKDGAVGRRILLAIQELDQFAGPASRRPLPELHRMPETPTAAAPDHAMTQDQLAFLEQLGQSTGLDEEAKVSLISVWRKGLSPAERRAVNQALREEPKSLADQLEELLQLRLVHHPTLAGRSIHFRSAPGGELKIDVDGGLYEAVDDVPYPDVVRLLKETVQIWEQR